MAAVAEQIPMPVEEVASIEEVASVEEVAPVEEVASVEEVAAKQEEEVVEIVNSGDDSEDEAEPEMTLQQKMAANRARIEAAGADVPKVQNVPIETPKSRQEKKARKAIQKLGLKLVPGITRVVIKKTKTMLFAINNPEVFQTAGSDTYVVFGEAKVEDLGQNQQMQAAQQLQKAQQEAAARQAAAAVVQTAKPTLIEEEAEDDEDDDAVDVEGLEEKDIDLVVQQANCSKSKAVKSLRNNNGDIVNAIMELTM